MEITKLKTWKIVDLAHPSRRKWTLALAAIVLPYFLNDILLLCFESNVLATYLIDYLGRVLILFLCVFFFGFKDGLRLQSSVAPKEVKDKLIDYLFVPLVFITIYYFFRFIIMFFSPLEWSFGFRFPIIEDPLWHWFDLTFGLLLVAISEELVFRRHVYAYFGSLFKIDWPANIMQALLFGFMHWGAGVNAVINATLFGVLAGVFYDRKKYLGPLIIFHWLADFLVFSGLTLRL